jgi:hypothetical protein
MSIYETWLRDNARDDSDESRKLWAAMVEANDEYMSKSNQGVSDEEIAAYIKRIGDQDKADCIE